MKKIILLLFVIFIGLSVNSQELIGFNNNRAYVSGYNAKLAAYKTHFKTSTYQIIKLIHNQDVIIINNSQIWSSTEDELTFYISSFPSIGSYDLYIENDIDSIMYLENALQVFSNYSPNIAVYMRTSFNSGIDTAIIVCVYGSNLQLNGLDSAAFYNDSDTIAIDSLDILSNDSVKIYFEVPDSAVGYYDLMFYNTVDSIFLGQDFMRIINPQATQIAYINPDSISNLHSFLDTIFVYGNNTHFMTDSIKVFSSEWLYDGIDALKVYNDTLLSLVMVLPLPLKGAVSPNCYLCVYNPIDGLLKYPMKLQYFGSIGDKEKSFSSINYYPNPTRDYFYISSKDFQTEESINVKILSIEGKLMFESNYNKQSEIKINIQDLAKGIYIVSLKGKAKENAFKIIKE